MSSPPVDDNDAHLGRHARPPVVGRLTGDEVAAELPRLAEGVRRALASRGVSFHEAEDIAQEAVARALAQRRPFASIEHLDGWCFLTAWRLATDRWRQSQRHPQTDLIPDLALGDGLDQPVQYRAAVAQLLDAIGSLTAGQQRAVARILQADFAAQREFLTAVDSLPAGRRAPLEAIVALFAETTAGPASATDRWARHDARTRLRRLVQDFPAVVVARLRPIGRALRARLSDKARWVSTTAMLGATSVAVSLLVEFGAAPRVAPNPGGAGSPVVVTAPAAEVVEVPAPPPSRSRAATASPAPPSPVAGPPRAGDVDGRVTVVTFQEPVGGGVHLVPNAPGKPLACAGADGRGACLSKPVSLRLPPLLPSG